MRRVDARKKDDFGQQETEAEVLVDSVPVRLELAVAQGEDGDGQGQADDRNAAADVGDGGQSPLVERRQRCRVEIHQYGEVGQVVASALGVRPVGGQHPASFVRPSADGVVPEDARRIGNVILAQMLEADRHRLRQLDVTALAQRGGNHSRVDDPRRIVLLRVVERLLLLLLPIGRRDGPARRLRVLIPVVMVVVMAEARRAQNVLHVLVGEQNDADEAVVAVLQQGLGGQSDPVLFRFPHLKLLGRGERQLVDVPHVQHSNRHH